MDILYLLIPLSSVLVLCILAVFGWALNSGQFDDVEQHGEQILDAAQEALDLSQGDQASVIQQSPLSKKAEAIDG